MNSARAQERLAPVLIYNKVSVRTFLLFSLSSIDFSQIQRCHWLRGCFEGLTQTHLGQTYCIFRTKNFDQKENTECCTTMIRPGITRSNLGEFVVDFFKLYEWNTSLIVYTS